MAYKKQESQKDENKQKQQDSACCNEDKKNYNCKHQHDEKCKCEDKECHCHEEKNTDKECECKDCKCQENKPNLADEYLNMARIIQADFDNYRKRSIESIKQAKRDGMISAIEVILPSLDVFKKAKQMIKDEADKKGIEMVENEINNSLKTLGVEKIDTQNAKFDPNLHHALSIVEDKTKPDNVIVDEYQAGYKLGDKVIKYSQVIVNKLKEEK